jgi:sialic acid synthase SpsE
MLFGNFPLSEKVLVVAEIGNNHEGIFETARRLVLEAAACGVDAVKFQTFRTEHFVSRADPARFDRLKGFELSFSQFEELAGLARSQGLLFISTPLDLGSAAFLENIVDFFKIASGDNNFYPLISQVALTGKPLIISTGLSDLQQVAQTVEFVRQQWAESPTPGQLAILHCVCSYPVPPEQVNLRAIPFLAAQFDLPVGYSDHTLGLEASLLAVALGARIIEKHFTLDKNFSDFRDHQLSADPGEMKKLVQGIRLASAMLGNYEKTLQPEEIAMVPLVRRSLAAGRDLPAGHCLDWSDLAWLRPGGVLAPGEELKLVGKRLRRDMRQGEQFSLDDLE